MIVDYKTAQEALKYWSLLHRAKKVGFKAPAHWYKYGDPPLSTAMIIEYNLAVFVERAKNIFESDNMFYRILRRR